MNAKHFIAVASVASLVLVGCFGETRPATNVRPNGAALQGHFTANNGPAENWFEYWKTSEPGTVFRTSRRGWPAGSSTQVEHWIPERPLLPNNLQSRLRFGTSYSFRLCGEDNDRREPACAQTQTFTTPVGDAVEGHFANDFQASATKVYVLASAGAAGGNPQGSVHMEGFHEFNGFASCVAVSGDRAAVGAVGYGRDLSPTTPWNPETMLVSVEENPSEANGSSADWVRAAGHTAPDCSTASFDDLVTTAFVATALVQDAPGG